MEFNESTGDYKGPQRRRTIFKTEEEKWSYDANNLVALARRILQKDKPTVRDALDLATRMDDDLDKLRVAIALRLKTEINFDEIEATWNKYLVFIDGLNLVDPDKQKLKEMMSPQNYQSAVETAKELDPECRIPSYVFIIERLMKYSEKRLREICEMMQKPTIQIVPDNNFGEKISAMNRHKHYIGASGKAQEDASVETKSSSPYINVPRKKKVRITIDEGTPRPTRPAGVSPKLGKRRDYLVKQFVEKKMRNISADGMVTLIQRSLREAKEANDSSLVVDNWKDHNGTATILNPKSLARSQQVAFALFDLDDGQINFFSSSPDLDFGNACGRASVLLSKF